MPKLKLDRYPNGLRPHTGEMRARFKILGPYSPDAWPTGGENKRYCLTERVGSDWHSRGLFPTLAAAKQKQAEIVAKATA